MRKNFLLLFLLTLLPLAGWAQTATLGDVGLGYYTYGDATFPVPVVKDSEGALLTEGVHYDVTANAFKDEACTQAVTTSDADRKAMNADGTKYYRQIVGHAGSAYEGQTKVAWFTVDKAELTLTLNANALNRTYGDAQVAIKADGSQFTATSGLKFTDAWPGVKKGSVPTYSTSSNNADDYSTATPAKKLTFAGGWTPDHYTIKYVGALNIAPKAIGGTAVITAEQGDVVYTGKNITGVYTVKDKADGVVLTAGTDYTVSTVKDVTANYKPTIDFKGNYSGSITAATGFAVTAAPITVSIDDIEVTYNNTNQGNQVPAKFYYNGIVGDDIANAATIKGNFNNPTYASAGTAINAGEYVLTIGDDGDTGAETNYYFKDFLPAKLTIKKAPLAIEATADKKKLGTADPAFTLNDGVLTLYGGDYVSGVTFSREAGEDVGKYDITPDISAAKVMRPSWPSDIDNTANYEITVATPKAQFEIEQGGIVVTIKDAEKFYGQNDPSWTAVKGTNYNVTGLQAGDELPAFTITRDAGETPNGYALNATVTNPNPTKYETVTVVPGIFTIKKAQLEFTIPAQNVEIGKTKAALSKATITVTGINNSDAAANLYDLDFNGVTVDGDGKTTDNQTVANGIKATLNGTANFVKYGTTWYKVTDLYEIVTDKTVEPWTVGTTAYGKVIVGAGTANAIVFNTSADLSDYNKIKNQAGEIQNVTLNLNNRVTREVPAGTAHPWAAETWNTMVLPFEVTVAELSAQLGYAIVNRVDVSKTTENNVQFKLEMQKVPANEPFCVKTSDAIADGAVLNFANKLIVDGGQYPSVDAGNGYKFVGAYKNLTIDKNHPTYNFLRGDNVKWAHIGASSANSWTVVPFDAYVDLTAAAAPEMVTFTFQEIDGSTTAIKNVEASVNEVNAVKTGWYTIDGKKLNAAPAQKGIYIYNGKKYVVK